MQVALDIESYNKLHLPSSRTYISVPLTTGKARCMDTTALVKKAQQTQNLETIGEVLERVGVTRATYSLWKNGKCVPSAEHMQRLCELAGVSPDTQVLDVLAKATKSAALRATLERIKSRVAAIILLGATTLLAGVQNAAQCILCNIVEASAGRTIRRLA